MAYVFFINNSLTSGFFSYDQYMFWLKGFYVLGGPGRFLSMLLGHAGDFSRTDIGGDGFALSLLLFLIFNTLGWLAIIGTASGALARLLATRRR